MEPISCVQDFRRTILTVRFNGILEVKSTLLDVVICLTNARRLAEVVLKAVNLFHRHRRI
jgi:hypothetical protein